jgi:hypothetical protein
MSQCLGILSWLQCEASSNIIYSSVSCLWFIYMRSRHFTLYGSDDWLIVNDEVDGCERKNSWPNVKILSGDLPGWTEDNHETIF